MPIEMIMSLEFVYDGQLWNALSLSPSLFNVNKMIYGQFIRVCVYDLFTAITL